MYFIQTINKIKVGDDTDIQMNKRDNFMKELI